MNREAQIAERVAQHLIHQDLSLRDKGALRKAVGKVLEELVGLLKIDVTVTFDWKWEGKHRRETLTNPAESPEFTAWNEKAFVRPSSNVILVGRIRQHVLTELLKVSNSLDEEPEFIMESTGFDEALEQEIRFCDWKVEDEYVELPRGSTTSDIEMVPHLSDGVLRIEYRVGPKELAKVMETVDENADEWFKVDPGERD